MILAARYANPDHTSAVIRTDDRGEVAVEIGTDAWAELMAWGEPDAFVEPVPPVPASVTPLQARKALRATGLKPQVDSFIATLSDEEREEWEYAIEIRRDNALIAAATGALGLTSDDVDGLFRLAASL